MKELKVLSGVRRYLRVWLLLSLFFCLCLYLVAGWVVGGIGIIGFLGELLMKAIIK